MLTIRPATINDAEQKGQIHYQTWIETYTGHINQAYLDRMKPERSVEFARKYPENTLVAELDGKIVGFACYGKSRDLTYENHGEIIALYVLKGYQKLGIGRALMESCLEQLKVYPQHFLWVLKSNQKAIAFYEKMGFMANGDEKELVLETPVAEIRMVALTG